MSIDIGLNLASKQFEYDYRNVIRDAMSSGVNKFLLTGTDLKSSKRVLEFCKMFNTTDNIMKATTGIHPTHCGNLQNNWKDQLKKLYDNTDSIAIGETGLDYYRSTNPDRKIQMNVFEEQVRASIELNKPLFLHLRPGDSCKNIIEDFKQVISNAKISGVVHCYTGDLELLEYILSLNLYVGMTGYITEKRGEHLKELIKIIPKDKLLIETDAPYLTPRNIKNLSRRNVPENMKYIIEYISEILGMNTTELDTITEKNTLNLFNWE